jgi:hypothetical protein
VAVLPSGKGGNEGREVAVLLSGKGGNEGREVAVLPSKKGKKSILEVSFLFTCSWNGEKKMDSKEVKTTK